MPPAMAPSAGCEATEDTGLLVSLSLMLSLTGREPPAA
jgi:hypothetical protein